MAKGKHIIYEVLYGSDAYGTTTDDSDCDIRGIYLPTVYESLGLLALDDVKEEQKDGQGNIVLDSLIFPIQKFFRLSLKSNPSVIEWLYVPKSCIRKATRQGYAIRDARDMFLSKEIYPRFKGFATSEFIPLPP